MLYPIDSMPVYSRLKWARWHPRHRPGGRVDNCDTCAMGEQLAGYMNHSFDHEAPMDAGDTLLLSDSPSVVGPPISAAPIALTHTVAWCRGHYPTDDDFEAALRGRCKWGITQSWPLATPVEELRGLAPTTPLVCPSCGMGKGGFPAGTGNPMTRNTKRRRANQLNTLRDRVAELEAVVTHLRERKLMYKRKWLDALDTMGLSVVAGGL